MIGQQVEKVLALDLEKIGVLGRFGFDDAAMAAAKRTKWRPATKNGVRVKMWVDLTIAFRP